MLSIGIQKIHLFIVLLIKHWEQVTPSQLCSPSCGWRDQNKCFPCDHRIKASLDDLPIKNNEKKLSCPECNVDLKTQIPEKFYSCLGFLI